MKASQIIKASRKSASAKDATLIAAVIKACEENGMPSFMLMHWQDGNAKSGSSTVHTQQMRPGDAMNLALRALDLHVDNMKKMATEKSPAGYVEALDAFRLQVKDAVLTLDAKLVLMR